MKKILLSLTFIASICSMKFSSAQTPSWGWASNAAGTNSEAGSRTITDAAGNVYVVGQFSSPSISFNTNTLTNAGANTEDVFLAKFDQNGNAAWGRSAGSSGSDLGNSIGIDNAGNIYIAGEYKGFSLSFGAVNLMNFDAPAGEIFVAKYDLNGNLLWAKNYGGDGSDAALGIAVKGNEEFFLTGEFQSDTIHFGATNVVNSSATGFDMFVARFDSSGNATWATGVGGPNDDTGNDIGVDATDNVFVVGGYQSPLISFGSSTLTNNNGGGNSKDVWALKFSGAGTPAWGKTYGGPQDDMALGCHVTSIGVCFFTGSYMSATITFGSTTLTNTGSNINDMFMTGVDGIGNSFYAFNGGSAGNDIGRGVVSDQYDNAYYCGRVNGDIYITKIDSIGVQTWVKSTGDANGLDNANDMVRDLNGNMIVTGSYGGTACDFDGTSYTTSGPTDMYVAKLELIPTSVGSIADKKFTIYPNPSNGNFKLTLDESIFNSNIDVINTLGEVVYSAKAGAEASFEVNTTGLSDGIYFVRISANGISKIEKLVISK